MFKFFQLISRFDRYFTGNIIIWDIEKTLDIYTIQKLLKISISMSIGFYMLDMVLKYAVYVQRISVYRSLRICFRGSQEFTTGAYFPKYIKILAWSSLMMINAWWIGKIYSAPTPPRHDSSAFFQRPEWLKHLIHARTGVLSTFGENISHWQSQINAPGQHV